MLGSASERSETVGEAVCKVVCWQPGLALSFHAGCTNERWGIVIGQKLGYGRSNFGQPLCSGGGLVKLLSFPSLF